MKRYAFFAFITLAFISISMERRASWTHAAFAQEKRKAEPTKAETTAKAELTTAETQIVRELDLEGLKKVLQRGATKDAPPLLVNFWATWCEPCREEFPDLVRIEADYQKRGLEMVFISLDDMEEIKTGVPQFLRQMKADKIPSYLLNVPDPEPAIKAVDTEWQGALPATFLFDAQGKLVFKHTGRIKPAELRTALDAVIKNPQK